MNPVDRGIDLASRNRLTAADNGPHAFGDFFGVPLERMYGLELKIAERLGFLFKKDGIWQMTPKGAFYFHHYENFYTLAYIDKMWGIMRREAFPERIEL